MHPYVAPIYQHFEAAQNPSEAYKMKLYMRNQFEFFGLKQKERTAVTKSFFLQYGLPDIADYEAVVRQLWLLPEREMQYFALSLLDKMYLHFTPQSIELIEWLILTKSWWDTIDYLAPSTFGTQYLKLYPQQAESISSRWAQTDNVWLKRSAIIFQLKYKRATDATLLAANIEHCRTHTDFFVQKAIGWALRQYARTEPLRVQAYVEATPLPELSRREALKHLAR